MTTLYHMTSIQNAVSILRSQEMHPGNHGLCGAAIYFTADPSHVHSKAHSRGVILQAQVDLGRVMMATKSHVGPNEDWAGILDRRGYDSVQCQDIPSGDEFVVYDPRRVRSIKMHSAQPHVYNGTLQVSADGRSGTGRSMSNYPVRIVAINQRPSWPCPILLGDDWSDQLGWAAPESLRVA
jgi:hypothetical protein